LDIELQFPILLDEEGNYVQLVRTAAAKRVTTVKGHGEWASVKGIEDKITGVG
jgi:hypothetical protein